MRRLLAIFLDGYEQALGQRLMNAGEMPAMAKFAASSARFLLDHGPGQRTGLAGEHIATGLSPDAARRWSALHFDPRTYTVWQEGTSRRPFAADLRCRTVVFDAPYFDLRAAPAVMGLVSWGAHDPGVAESSRPTNLLAEVKTRFGCYPAPQWIYGQAWMSAERSRAMGDALARAVDVRADAAQWLLSERFPDWDLALVTVSEPHSAIEGLWHGVDSTHPLHSVPSAKFAQAGIHSVYHAVDRLIGRLSAAFADAVILVFAMGGMGPNRSDVPSMLLLPELLYRHAFGSPFFRQPPEWRLQPGGCPLLPPDTNSWEAFIATQFPRATESRSRQLTKDLLPRVVKKALRHGLERLKRRGRQTQFSLSWMPAAAYQQFWRAMPAFALPSYYDGRVRLNLIGRENRGMVGAPDYQRVLAEVENLIRACTDPATGGSVVDFVERPAKGDPCRLTNTQTDLVVVWKEAATCFEHPVLGRIGPVPYRRTGGHTGLFGMAYLRADGVSKGDHGIRSAYDIVPTIIELTAKNSDRPISGLSLLSNMGPGRETPTGREPSTQRRDG